MNGQELLTDRLADIADAIDAGGPVIDSILFGLPLIQEDGSACEPSLMALGFSNQGGAWVRGNERYVVKTGEYVSADIPLAEIDGLRNTLLARAVNHGVVVYLPPSVQVDAMGLAPARHPVKIMLASAPNLRLLFAPGTNHHSELAGLLAVRAVNWPQAMRISLEAHASFAVSPNARINLEAARRVILRETRGGDRIRLLEELAARYGRRHANGPDLQKDDVFAQALAPYLSKAFLHD